MKELLILALLFLVACSSNVPPPVLAPAATVVEVSQACQFAEEGEACRSNCECKSPLDCVERVCRQVKLDDGALCATNSQCKSNYCTDNGRCGGPDGPTSKYYCEKKYDHKAAGGVYYTSCRYASPV